MLCYTMRRDAGVGYAILCYAMLCYAILLIIIIIIPSLMDEAPPPGISNRIRTTTVVIGLSGQVADPAQRLVAATCTCIVFAEYRARAVRAGPRRHFREYGVSASRLAKCLACQLCVRCVRHRSRHEPTPARSLTPGRAHPR